MKLGEAPAMRVKERVPALNVDAKRQENSMKKDLPVETAEASVV